MSEQEKQCDCIDICEWSCENAGICKSLFIKTYSEGEVSEQISTIVQPSIDV